MTHAPIYSSQHRADDFDALLAQRRRDAKLPEMHADTYEGEDGEEPAE